jgi:hypothetical protein
MLPECNTNSSSWETVIISLLCPLLSLNQEPLLCVTYYKDDIDKGKTVDSLTKNTMDRKIFRENCELPNIFEIIMYIVLTLLYGLSGEYNVKTYH